MVSTRYEHANNWYQLEYDKVVEGIFSFSVLRLTALVLQVKKLVGFTSAIFFFMFFEKEVEVLSGILPYEIYFKWVTP